ILRGRKGVTVLERLDQPLACDLPLMREIRATLGKAMENGQDPRHPVYPELDTYESLGDAPALYSGSFGMGSRDLQPEGVVAAVENMLPDGKKKRLFYLSIDFLRDEPKTPKQAAYQGTIEEAYPDVKELALRGSENPNLMPENSITVRFHSVGGWGAITTGKNLAMTLFDLLGYHIKANPKYGSEKKGQPTTYYLSASPEPIRMNSEYFYVDVVLSPDPNVFQHTNALAGLKEGGVFIIQSDQPTPDQVWESIPVPFQKIIRDKELQVFSLDAFRIAREEASDSDLQLRMQGIAFQGAFFAASSVMEQAGLSDQELLDAIEAQLQEKFGSKGARVVEDNLRVVKRGFDEVARVPVGELSDPDVAGKAVGAEPDIPVMVKAQPKSAAPVTDIHRFWEQTGNFYARGMGNDNLTDPFIGLGVMPACSALFRDMTQIRCQHPEWNAEACTACGKCYTVCPDTAIPGLVNTVGQVFDTVVKRVRKAGHPVEHLPKAVRTLESKLRPMLAGAKDTDPVAEMLEEALEMTSADSGLDGEERQRLDAELELFRKELDDFPFALSRPYFGLPEKDRPGGGGLLSITVNPYTCKGCMECVEVCDDDALKPVTQTDESVQRLRDQWDFWLDLPTTPQDYIRIDNLEEGIGALETLLLDKKNYLSFTSGDGACLGCAEKTVMHLFVATIEALMTPRIEKHVAHINDLISRLEQHIQLKLVSEIQVGDSMKQALENPGEGDLTLAAIAERMERLGDARPIDPEWLRRTAGLVESLKNLRWKYTEGTTGTGRSSLGMINATGCSSVWGSTYPFNPYPFPWANHLFQDSPSMAMGVFEGHMAKMAEGFRAIRMAEMELDGGFDPEREQEFLTYFNWHQFTDEEWELCPPVVSVGGDGAMYDIGFQNLSRVMASGKPIKVLVLDTQVYSNTGGQACTSGFIGQVSDMAQYGKAIKGKEEPRKEIGLIGMAHRTTYILQSTIAQPGHMIEGFIQGLKARRPALFNLYTSCQPEHGIGDDMGSVQAKLAVESRAYPLFRYDPEAGKTPEECFDLEGNPAPDQDWPTYTLKYKQGRRDKEMTLPMTFADFAMTEVRFRKQFRIAPPDTWNDSMMPLAEFLDLPEDDREGRFPYIWSVDRKNELTRLLVAEPMVQSCEDRRDFWTMLRSLAGTNRKEPSRTEIEEDVRREISGRLAQSLLQLATGDGGGFEALLDPASGSAAPGEAGAPG
ncbi:MAG: 4Fe-4S binding protein, partial [Gemmatimonadetes bacterium]|nr:4Fe-4S binding protein [Gemmatimonadota bacterium]